MGSFELQIFVSLFVILGAAFVALLCDFLKGNNERLREKNIELSVRHEERDKREDLLDRAQRQAWNTAVQAQEAWLYQSMRGSVPDPETDTEAPAGAASPPVEAPTAGDEPQLTFSIGVKPLEGPLSPPLPEMLTIDARPQPSAGPPAPAMPRMAAPPVEGLLLSLQGPCYPAPEPPHQGPASHPETSAAMPLSLPLSSALVEPTMEVPGSVPVGVPCQPASSCYRWSEPAESFAWAAWRLLPGFVRSWLERTPPEAALCPLVQELSIEPPLLFVPPFALVEFGSGYVSAMPALCLRAAEASPALPPMVSLPVALVDRPAGIRFWGVHPEAGQPAVLLPAFCPPGQEEPQLGELAPLSPVGLAIVAPAGGVRDRDLPGCLLQDSPQRAALLSALSGLKTEPSWGAASADPPMAGHSEVARAASPGWKLPSRSPYTFAIGEDARLPETVGVSLHPAHLAPGEQLPLQNPALCASPAVHFSFELAPPQQPLPVDPAAPLLSIAADVDTAFSADCETVPELAATVPVSLPGLSLPFSRTYGAAIAEEIPILAGCVPGHAGAPDNRELALAGQIEWTAAATPLSARVEARPSLAAPSPVSLPGLSLPFSRTDGAAIAEDVLIPAGRVPDHVCAPDNRELALAGQIEWTAALAPLSARVEALPSAVPVPPPIDGQVGRPPRLAPFNLPAPPVLPGAAPLGVPLPQALRPLPADPLPDGEPAHFTLTPAWIPAAELRLELTPLGIPPVAVPVPIEQGLVRRTYHLFAPLPPAMDHSSGSLPPASFDLSAPDTLPEAPPAPIVRIRVLREDDAFAHLATPGLDPLASDELAANTPSALESFSTRAGFLSAAAPPTETPTVAGDFAPETPLPQKSSAQPPGILTMPSFGEMKTLFFPSAPNIERKPDRPGVVVKMPAANALSCAPGVHPPAILQQLLSRQELFSGMAMVLAVVDYQKVAHLHPASVIEPILEEAFDAMRAGAGKNAFLCRCADGEFVILWPRDWEPNPQKALHEVTERLWDFQLRTLGAVPLIFGWGNLESPGESLAGVLTAARDRMTESARNRRSTASGVGRFRRHAVS